MNSTMASIFIGNISTSMAPILISTSTMASAVTGSKGKLFY